MKRLLISAAAAASLTLGGCTTEQANDPQVRGAVRGGAIGAVAGGVAGAVIPGIGVGGGAALGAVLGGVVGAVVNGKQYYRDTRGYCYYVDQSGQPHYDYNVRC